MVVWPFKIRDAMIESLEWLTDVIRSKNLEQRFSMRQRPRTIYNFTHHLTLEEYNAAQSLIRQNTSFLVPEWQSSVTVGAVSPGAGVSLVYGEPYSQLEIGDRILIWESSERYESVLITDTDSADTFIGDVDNNYSNARLVPLHTAEAPNGLRPGRQAGNIINAQIAFELTDVRDIGQADYIRYQGHEVITDCPVIASQTFQEPIQFPTDTFDDGINYPVYLDQRNFYDYNKVMRWHLFSRSEIYTLRRFLHSRRGRWKAFWLPTFSADFELFEPIVSSNNYIVVYPPSGITDLGITSFDIEIDGQYYRSVTSYAVATIGGVTALQLNIDSTLGVNLPVDTRISYLHFMRFDADRVEINHAAKVGASVAIPTIELNEL